MDNIIFETSLYKLVETDQCIGEDGKYGVNGYALVNKQNGFVEATGMLRANMIFLCDQASSMLNSLNKGAEEDAVIEGIEDVVQH